jgi:hypothetical protein
MKRLLSHPANREHLLKAFGEERDPTGMGFMSRDFPMFWDVQWSDHLPIRKTRQDWHPPVDDRFCIYGPEDEGWMRPLGLGRFETVDEGPLFYLIDLGLLMRFRSDLLPVIRPSYLFSYLC